MTLINSEMIYNHLLNVLDLGCQDRTVKGEKDNDR